MQLTLNLTAPQVACAPFHKTGSLTMHWDDEAA